MAQLRRQATRAETTHGQIQADAVLPAHDDQRRRVHDARGGPVRVVAGADVQDMDLGGQTVAEARAVAAAVLGLAPDVQALLDGREVGEEQILRPGQTLQFVRWAGQKGASLARALRDAVAGEPRLAIEIAADRATWQRDGRVVGTAKLGDLMARIVSHGRPAERWLLHPQHTRLIVERDHGRTVGVVVEMPPGPHQVRWVAATSRAGYGPGARYETYNLSFPWIVLLLVFQDGNLTGAHQAFYRTAPLASLDDPLCYTNLLNVARGYSMESWVCLVNLGHSLAPLGWEERIQAVVAHFWAAAFNRSSEAHEGNSFWQTSGEIDSRLATPEAWQEATRAQPYFTLGVQWRRAGHTLGQALEHMLERVSPWRPIERVEQLVTLMQRGGA